MCNLHILFHMKKLLILRENGTPELWKGNHWAIQFSSGMNWIWKQRNVLISLFNESDECVFAFQASFCWREGKNNCVSVSVCVCLGREEVQGWRRWDWVSGPDNQFSFLRPLERGVCMSPSDRTPFPAIKPSKNIPFVSVTAPDTLQPLIHVCWLCRPAIYISHWQYYLTDNVLRPPGSIRCVFQRSRPVCMHALLTKSACKVGWWFVVKIGK